MNDPPTSGVPAEQPSGLPEAEYHSHARTWRNVVLEFSGFLIFFGVVLLLGIESERGFLKVMCVIPAVIVLLVFGLCGLAYRLIFRIRLGVYANGVLATTTLSETFTRWEDIVAIYEADPPQRDDEDRFYCGFRQAGGRRFVFHTEYMNDLRDFANRLHKRVDARIRADALQKLTSGAVAWFGPLGISRDGFHSRKGLLPWSEVSFVGYVRGIEFEVLKRNTNWGWFSCKIGAMENVEILNELIKTRKEWTLPG
jgi:hypothetical protein